MKFRPSLIASASAILVSFLAGCGDDTNTPAPVAGAAGAPVVAGSGGSAGASAGATFGGSSAGTGSPSAGTGGLSAGTGGVGGASAGSGGSATGGASGGGSGGVGAGGGTAGTGTAGGGTTVPATFETVKKMFNETPCFGTVCHDLPENPLYLKGSDDEVYARMMTETTRDCGPLINKANPAESALVKLLKGPCGDTMRMPLGMCVEDEDLSCVPPETIAAVQQWIAMGAPKN